MTRDTNTTETDQQRIAETITRLDTQRVAFVADGTEYTGRITAIKETSTGPEVEVWNLHVDLDDHVPEGYTHARIGATLGRPTSPTTRAEISSEDSSVDPIITTLDSVAPIASGDGPVEGPPQPAHDPSSWLELRQYNGTPVEIRVVGDRAHLRYAKLAEVERGGEISRATEQATVTVEIGQRECAESASFSSEQRGYESDIRSSRDITATVPFASYSSGEMVRHDPDPAYDGVSTVSSQGDLWDRQASGMPPIKQMIDRREGDRRVSVIVDMRIGRDAVDAVRSAGGRLFVAEIRTTSADTTERIKTQTQTFDAERVVELVPADE